MEEPLSRAFARMAALPGDALLAVFKRYGRPLAVAMPAPAAEDRRASVRGPDGGPATVRVLQVLGYGDVIPNDYFVLEMGGETPLAISAPFFASALEALARAAGLA